MPNEKVSLYIPCYNAEATIQYCLEAVFKQKYPLKEVVIIDDGSSDKTVEIASRYPVKIIRHDKNKGLAASRNTAIKNVKTEFVASLDADCVAAPGWLEQLMQKFDSSKIAGAGGKLLETHSSTIFDFWRSAHMKQHWEDKETVPPFLFGSNTVFRRETLINIGLYNENYKNNYEDVDICNRLKEIGCSLIYEPNAIVDHIKKDDIYSVLNNYWRWNLGYYQRENYYSDAKSFIFKIKDNLGLANRYIEEDVASKRYELLYLDFLLALHHSLRDFEYFISQNNKNLDIPGISSLSSWLTLLDLTFFYHFNSKKEGLSTLIPQAKSFLQNFFALNLILGNCIQDKFKNDATKKKLYRHLLLSVYNINDTYLLQKLLNLVELHQDWDGLIKKKHPNLNILFLKNLSLNFQKWLENLRYRFPGIVQMIESSAEKINEVPV